MLFGPYKAKVLKVVDGDTLKADILLVKRKRKIVRDLGFNVHTRQAGICMGGILIRFAGCDAPELKTAAGKKAKEYLDGLVRAGETVTVLSQGWDKFAGRIDAKVTLADGTDLTQAMIEAGHAKAWDGRGPRP